MPNVGRLQQRIENALQFGPSANEWNVDVLDLLNEVQDAILLMHPWTFRWAEFRFATYADVDIGYAHWDRFGNRAVDTDIFASTDYQQFGEDRLAWALLGNYLERSDPTTLGAQRFVIEQVESGGSLGYTLSLDPRYELTGTKPTGVTWSMRFDRIAMPADCESILEVKKVGSRDPLIGWDPVRQSRVRAIDPEATGPAMAWMLDVPGRSGPTNAALLDMGRGQNYPYTGGADLGIPQAPLVAPSLALTAGAGLEVGVRWEYAYTWCYAGQESGLSPTAKITTTTGNGRVALAGLEVLPDSYYGRIRNIYRRRLGDGSEGSANGPWWRIDQLTNPTASTGVTDLGTVGQSTINPVTDVRYGGEAVPTRIRLIPRPQDFSEYTVRYLRRPRRLEHPSDVPELPEPYHALLVHGAMVEFAARNEGFKLSADHAQRFRALLGEMRARYLNTDQSAILQNGQMFPGRGASMLATLVPLPIAWET